MEKLNWGKKGARPLMLVGGVAATCIGLLIGAERPMPALARTAPPLASGAREPNALKISQKADDLNFQDLKGHSYAPADLSRNRATAFLFLSTECPVSNGYSPRYIRFAQSYKAKGIQVVGVYSNRNETPEKIARHAKEFGYSFPIVHDESGTLARRLGIRMTPEVALLDATGSLRYRGRFDDNRDVTKVERSDLRDALDAVLSGKKIKAPETQAFGCFIAPADANEKSVRTPTYAKDIAPILQQNCQTCHRPGEVGPMSLMTYEQASTFAKTIKNVTERRVMPPWHAAEGFGEFQHSRRLTDEQVKTLAAWADSGAPLGDAKDMPKPMKFNDGWKLGQPDVVYQAPEPFAVAADGEDVYRNFVIPTDFKEDRYVSAIEVRPDKRQIVHHVIAYIDARPNEKGRSLEWDEKDPGPGYTSSGGGINFDPDGMIGGWAPGNEPRVLPDGIAVKVAKGANVVMQVHYHKNGKAEKDRTQIALYFSKKPVNKLTQPIPVVNLEMEVPAGASRHEIKAEWTTDEDMHAITVMPHMHLLGREMKVTATRPDGTVVPMVHVPDWDFRWQDTYVYKEPIALPKGTKVKVVAYYDNSEQNLNNPNKPPKAVRWGEQTTDEMCLAYVSVTRDAENLALNPTVNGEKKVEAESQKIRKAAR